MRKYIDAEKLTVEIKGIIAAVQAMKHPDVLGTIEQCLAAAEIEALNLVLDTIKELQQEQPEVDLVAELKRHLATTPKEQLEKEWKELEPWGNIGPTVQEFLYGKQPKVQNGKFVFPKYLYARTKDNKTIDMSYAPQDIAAIEYIRNDSIEQEPPEVDIEKEIGEHSEQMPMCEFTHESEAEEFIEWAKKEFQHFYELGLNARKEK